MAIYAKYIYFGRGTNLLVKENNEIPAGWMNGNGG